MPSYSRIAFATLLTFCLADSAFSYDFDIGDAHASWVTNLTGAAGIRTKNQSCALVGSTDSDCGTSANTAQYANGDDGNLNYNKGDFYTATANVVSEVLLTIPSQGLKFLVRGAASYDFAAGNTQRTDLTPDAKSQTVYPVQLLDAWGEKDFQIAGNKAHVRIGNQVINWGESIYATGGINATNAFDIQKLLTPGTQLKQALLPSPMVSFYTDLGRNFSTEMYYQFGWSSNRYPAVGTYFSAADILGRGAQPYSISLNNPNVQGTDGTSIARGTGTSLASANSGLVSGAYAEAPYSSIGVPYTNIVPGYSNQYGLRLNWSPSGTPVNMSFYFLNYTDKAPVINTLANGTANLQYLQNRKLLGVSGNAPIGDWAFAWEVSYRPHDAVSLSQCYGAGGSTDATTNGVAGACKNYVDRKKIQVDINGLLSLTPSSYPFIKLLGASAANLTLEATWINYPGLHSNSTFAGTVNGVPVYQVLDAGYAIWTQTGANGYAIGAAQGTPNSVGLTADFNWTYDGTLIHGWQVTPGVTFTDAVYGYTPTTSANYEQGAKSLNVYVLFAKNPATWNGGINYTMFFGGNALSQPYADRNYVGAFITRTF